MKKGKAYTLDYRRKREGKTNYRVRLKILASKQIRIVVRRGLNNITVQLVKYYVGGDRILVSAYTKELLKYGWKGHMGNISSAYLVGLLCGLKAKKNNIKLGVLDLGLYRSVAKSSFFAVVKGLKDTGFSINASEETMPSEERLLGKHIESYANELKGKSEYEKQFSKYIKLGLKPEEISKHVEEVKKKISEKWQ